MSMLEKIYTTEEKQALAQNALDYLNQNQWHSPFPWAKNPSYTTPDNGMRCTCQGIQIDPDCPCHRVIR